MRLKDRVAIITGAGNGMGAADAVLFAKEGAKVVVNDIREENAETVAKQIQDTGGEAFVSTTDVTKAEEVEAMVAETIDKWGKVDILLNNAGICPREPLLDYPEEYWTDTLQVNLNAPWFLAQAAARQMVKQGYGKIINIASLLSHQGGRSIPGYTASKHGVAGFTKAMANELASKGVNVNSITPGYVLTDLTKPLLGLSRIETRIPMGRWATPEDLQGACVLLASEAGDYIHGADIVVDGGWLAF